MAASITTDFSMPLQAAATSVASTPHNRRRRISPQAGHALETLGHAIEYLADEFAVSEEATFSRNSHLDAVQLLMSLNRQVYFECPVVPTMGERLRSLLHMGAR